MEILPSETLQRSGLCEDARPRCISSDARPSGVPLERLHLLAAKRPFQLGGDGEVDVEALAVADGGISEHKQTGQEAYRGGALEQLLMKARRQRLMCD
jgi:hypothetical protein